MEEWIYNLMLDPTSAMQCIIMLSFIMAVGMSLGKVKIFGVSLGVTFVFFTGIIMGHFGFSIDPRMAKFARDFGLVLFVYELGLQVGPGFFASIKEGGMRLNLLALTSVFIATALTIGFSFLPGLDIRSMTGVMCGATTNTPAMGAAQQTLTQMGQDATDVPLGWAVAYPMGVVGVILAMVLVKSLFVKASDIVDNEKDANDNTYIATFRVHNPGIVGKSIREIGIKSGKHFIISRLWRDGKVYAPRSESVLSPDDRVLVVTTKDDAESLRMLFGTEEEKDWNKSDIDWNAIDNKLVSKTIIVTKSEINGKRLGSLKLRNSYGINITRVQRSGIKLLATPNLILQLGDRLTVVGDHNSVQNVTETLGNQIKTLKEPNLVSTFIGIIIGLVVGSIPLAIPGLEQPLKLGLAGGPIVIGILIGRFGPRFHMVTYTTTSANLMLRGLGIQLYLASLGLDTGANFFETVMNPEGALWVLLGFLITVVPITITGIYALKVKKMDFGSTCGMMCGSTNNPMALGYANTTLPGNGPAVSYATVYPLTMFAKVIIAQLLIMIFA